MSLVHMASINLKESDALNVLDMKMQCIVRLNIHIIQLRREHSSVSVFLTGARAFHFIKSPHYL